MDDMINSVGDVVRRAMTKVAKRLDVLTGGKLSPNVVTITGLVMHIPIAWLIATNRNLPAVILLIIFGLFDALDGALARLQNRAGSAGMLLDAVTDRMKEIIVYAGVAWGLINSINGQIVPFSPPIEQIRWSMLTVIAALGGSLLVSYVKAKGETAVKDAKLRPNEINRLFQSGAARFEVRISLLILGLLTNLLMVAVLLVAVLSWITVFGRLININRKLNPR